MNLVEMNWRNVSKQPWETNVGDFIRGVLEHLEIDNWELSVLFCDDSCIRELNRTYRERDEATDVLSFVGTEAWTPMGDALVPVGDIVISLDTLQTNCEYFSVQINEEMKRLLIHGILHLDGMDHGSNDPSEPMLRMQEQILSKFTGVKIL